MLHRPQNEKNPAEAKIIASTGCGEYHKKSFIFVN
jgi:hypothetical protein